MPIEFTCGSCNQTLRVPDETAGKQARCPKCQAVIEVPMPNPPADLPPPGMGGDSPFPPIDPTAPPGGGSGFSDPNAGAPNPNAGAGGTAFGSDVAGTDNPFAFADSNAPKPDGPFGPPGGAMGPGEANPYRPPTPVEDKFGGPPVSGGIQPRRVEAGDVINYAVEVWKANLGLLVGVVAFLGVINFVFSMVSGGIEAAMREAGADEGAVVGLSLLISFGSNLVQVFLGIGQAMIALRLARGQRAEFGDLFKGGRQFPVVFGYSILVGIAAAIGFLLLIIPGFIVLIMAWPMYYLLVEERCSFGDALSASIEVAKINVGTILLLGLASFGITLLGFLALCVGLLFAAPLANMLWVVCYLMITGQLASNASYPPRQA